MSSYLDVYKSQSFDFCIVVIIVQFCFISHFILTAL